MVEVAAIVGAGLIGASGSKKAGKQAASAQKDAAQLQRESAKETLAFQEDLSDYTMALNEYQRHLAERNFNVGLGQYADQYGLTQKNFDLQRQQTDFGNRMKYEAQTNLQNFTNAGLGALPGLTSMTGNQGFADSGAYTGMRDIQELGRRVPLPEGVQGLPMESQVESYPVNDDLINAYINNRIEKRYPTESDQPKELSKGVYSIGELIDQNPLEFDSERIKKALEAGEITEEEAKRLTVYHLVKKKQIADTNKPGGPE